MSSAIEDPTPSVHHRRPLLWLIVAFAAVALTGTVLIVQDSRSESAVESRAASTGPLSTAPATPTVCWSQYTTLLAALETSMSPEALNRITPVLSEETRSGLLSATEVLSVTNSASPTPDPVTLAWAIGRLTPVEGAAIVAELPPAIQEAVANHAADSATILATLPPEIQEAVASGAFDIGLFGNPCP
jgi:hypothetical protein